MKQWIYEVKQESLRACAKCYQWKAHSIEDNAEENNPSSDFKNTFSSNRINIFTMRKSQLGSIDSSNVKDDAYLAIMNKLEHDIRDLE